MHAVALHGVLDLVDDCLSSCFDTQHFFHLEDMVGLGLFEIDSWCCHHLFEASTFDEKLMAAFIRLFLVDDSSVNRLNSFHNYFWQHLFQSLHGKIHFISARFGRIEINLGCILLVDMLLFDFDLPFLQDSLDYLFNRKF